jgi:hypothetical protein
VPIERLDVYAAGLSSAANVLNLPWRTSKQAAVFMGKPLVRAASSAMSKLSLEAGVADDRLWSALEPRPPHAVPDAKPSLDLSIDPDLAEKLSPRELLELRVSLRY